MYSAEEMRNIQRRFEKMREYEEAKRAERAKMPSKERAIEAETHIENPWATGEVTAEAPIGFGQEKERLQALSSGAMDTFNRAYSESGGSASSLSQPSLAPSPVSAPSGYESRYRIGQSFPLNPRPENVDRIMKMRAEKEREEEMKALAQPPPLGFAGESNKLLQSPVSASPLMTAEHHIPPFFLDMERKMKGQHVAPLEMHPSAEAALKEQEHRYMRHPNYIPVPIRQEQQDINPIHLMEMMEQSMTPNVQYVRTKPRQSIFNKILQNFERESPVSPFKYPGA